MFTAKQIAKMAKDLGLTVGKGKYNGAKFWVTPNSNAIITAKRVQELAGYQA